MSLFHKVALAIASIFALSVVTNDLNGADRPNVIVIMADDLGAEGLNCYGSTIYTSPHLDRMADEGIRFNNAYSTPLCTPTRVMIMSGLYPNRTGHVALIGKKPGSRMSEEIRTFGHDFKEAGYKTAIAGKWQLGKFNEIPEQPVEHGFDEYCMWTWFYGDEKHSRYYRPGLYTNGKMTVGKEEDYGPDIYANFLLDFIDRNKDEPFFIYFPMALVHSPFVDPPRLHDLAETKFTDDLDKNTKSFGRMITYMDDIVGQFRAKLEEHGIDKNTLILFTADNGTHKAITSKLPGMALKGGKGDMIESGVRVPLIAWWPGKVKPAVLDELFCLSDVLPTICSVAEIPLNREVDGMDLSHLLHAGEGKNRDHVFMAYKGGQYFVREHRLRLSQGSKKKEKKVTEELYDIPVTSNQERYSEKIADEKSFESERERLKKIMEAHQAIPREYNLHDDES